MFGPVRAGGRPDVARRFFPAGQGRGETWFPPYTPTGPAARLRTYSAGTYQASRSSAPTYV